MTIISAFAALARIGTLTGDYLDGNAEPERFAQHSARLIDGLLQDLKGHHQIEDTHYFPLLARLGAPLEAGFALLEADHHALDGHIHGLAEVTNAMLPALQGGGGQPAVGQVRAHARQFERFIDRHLTDEEDLVVPTILHLAPVLSGGLADKAGWPRFSPRPGFQARP